MKQSRLVYETKVKSPFGTVRHAPHTEGYEFYKINEGAVTPFATTSFGIMWDNFSHPQMLQRTLKMPVDKRVVVKTTLQLKINETGRIVTLVKTYLPKFIDNQSTIKIKY